MRLLHALCAAVLLTATVTAQKAEAPLRNAVDVPAKQVALRIGSRDAVAIPGQPIELIAELSLKPNVHVYAPGQADYIPISLTLGESADFKAEPAVYPAARSLYLEPIQQTAKVYENTFRITQRVTIELTPELKRRAAAGDTLAIPATLKYQACDDAVCYRPEAVKLTWQIKLATGAR
ncbi:MAG TPA: protein-disulfide reductase DsbD domain-containing protein [Vicinamibacterales bacterium]|nr:protein-disulfide reductase DsbD domain-containing protein [Vicinamibacterales bacterium]